MKRSERQIKTPPFAIAPRGAATLTEQVEEGLRQAILTGFYQDGDFIPGYVAFARKIGVSTAVVRPAIARLIADGLCKPRPGLGLQVCSRAPATVGNVLVVTCGDASAYRYYMASLVEHLRRRLSERHFTLSRAIVVRRDEKDDFSDLLAALNRHVNIAVILDNPVGTEETVAAAGVPYVLLSSSRPSGGAAGHLDGDTRKTAETIASHCAACGARRVLLAGLATEHGFHIEPPDLIEALEARSIKTRRFSIGYPINDSPTETLLAETIAAFRKMCVGGKVVFRGFRPDMVVFIDDCVAQGALLAMTEAGIRVPEDVQVMTMANKGLGPVWLKPLTRFEVDTSSEAAALAELLGDCLADRKTHHVRKVAMRLIAGQTTRKA